MHDEHDYIQQSFKDDENGNYNELKTENVKIKKSKKKKPISEEDINESGGTVEYVGTPSKKKKKIKEADQFYLLQQDENEQADELETENVKRKKLKKKKLIQEEYIEDKQKGALKLDPEKIQRIKADDPSYAHYIQYMFAQYEKQSVHEENIGENGETVEYVETPSKKKEKKEADPFNLLEHNKKEHLNELKTDNVESKKSKKKKFIKEESIEDKHEEALDQEDPPIKKQKKIKLFDSSLNILAYDENLSEFESETAKRKKSRKKNHIHEENIVDENGETVEYVERASKKKDKINEVDNFNLLKHDEKEHFGNLDTESIKRKKSKLENIDGKNRETNEYVGTPSKKKKIKEADPLSLQEHDKKEYFHHLGADNVKSKKSKKKTHFHEKLDDNENGKSVEYVDTPSKKKKKNEADPFNLVKHEENEHFDESETENIKRKKSKMKKPAHEEGIVNENGETAEYDKTPSKKKQKINEADPFYLLQHDEKEHADELETESVKIKLKHKKNISEGNIDNENEETVERVERPSKKKQVNNEADHFNLLQHNKKEHFDELETENFKRKRSKKKKLIQEENIEGKHKETLEQEDPPLERQKKIEGLDSSFNLLAHNEKQYCEQSESDLFNIKEHVKKEHVEQLETENAHDNMSKNMNDDNKCIVEYADNQTKDTNEIKGSDEQSFSITIKNSFTISPPNMSDLFSNNSEYLCPNEDPVDHVVSPLHRSETVYLSKEEEESLKAQGICIKKGKFNKEEDAVLTKNFEKFCSSYGVNDPILLLGIGKKHRNANVQKFLKAKHFLLRLSEGLDDRPLRCIYSRARTLLDPLKTQVKCDKSEISKIKLLYSIHGNRWHKIGGLLDRPAENCRQAFKFHDKVDINKGKWANQEEEKLIQAIKCLTQIENITIDNVKNVSWEKVAEHVSTRNSKQCRHHWEEYLSWDASSEREDWTKDCSEELLRLLNNEFSVKEEKDVDWRGLHEHFFHFTPSYKSLRKKWWRLKAKIPDYITSFNRGIEFLYACAKNSNL